MTMKDYVVIAEGLKSALSVTLDQRQRLGVARSCRYVADNLKKDNPKFRYDKFYDYIGLDSYGDLI